MKPLLEPFLFNRRKRFVGGVQPFPGAMPWMVQVQQDFYTTFLPSYLLSRSIFNAFFLVYSKVR